MDEMGQGEKCEGAKRSPGIHREAWVFQNKGMLAAQDVFQ